MINNIYYVLSIYICVYINIYITYIGGTTDWAARAMAQTYRFCISKIWAKIYENYYNNNKLSIYLGFS